MKSLSILLIPVVALFVSACGSGPGGPVYGGAVYGGGDGGGVYYGGPYGPGPSPQPGYFWNGDIYVEGTPPWWSTGYTYRGVHYNAYTSSRIDVNRTRITNRTVNNTTVNNTRVNDRTLNRTNINKTNVNRTNVNRTNVKTLARRKKVQPRENKRETNQPVNP